MQFLYAKRFRVSHLVTQKKLGPSLCQLNPTPPQISESLLSRTICAP